MSQTPSSEQSTAPGMDRVKQELERWLEAARKAGETAMGRLGMGADPREIPVDLFEDGAHVFVIADLPGVSTEALDLTVAGNMLTIAFTRSAPVLPGFPNCVHKERAVGAQTRSIPLPASVNGDAAVAELHHGLLKLTLPKTVPIRSTKVPVRQASESENIA